MDAALLPPLTKRASVLASKSTSSSRHLRFTCGGAASLLLSIGWARRLCTPNPILVRKSRRQTSHFHSLTSLPGGAEIPAPEQRLVAFPGSCGRPGGRLVIFCKSSIAFSVSVGGWAANPSTRFAYSYRFPLPKLAVGSQTQVSATGVARGVITPPALLDYAYKMVRRRVPHEEESSLDKPYVPRRPG